MNESKKQLVFLKLGGSLITDKRSERAFRKDEMRRLATEIRDLLDQQSDLQLLIGHGSGSFGHVVAQQYNTKLGVRTEEEWYGFATVADAAAELNSLVTRQLREAGIAAFRFQPSASAQCSRGVLQYLATNSIVDTLKQGLVPLIYGDVAYDQEFGGTIVSTEKLFEYLASKLSVTQILLLGEVEGVFGIDGNLIPAITSRNFASIRPALGGSSGTDVTGGMVSKVESMLQLACRQPGLEIRICDGRQPGIIANALFGLSKPGTVIYE